MKVAVTVGKSIFLTSLILGLVLGKPQNQAPIADENNTENQEYVQQGESNESEYGVKGYPVCNSRWVTVFDFEKNYVEEDSLQNIRIRHNNIHSEMKNLKLTYGDCRSNHYETVIGETALTDFNPKKFVWATPTKEARYLTYNVCIKVWSNNCMVGRSKPFSIVPSSFNYEDEDNAWRYDAVKDFKINGKFVANQSPKSVGIAGAGIAGMFSAFLLESTKLPYKVNMFESNKKRIGGRIWTYHFQNGSRYDYHELGAMRINAKIVSNNGAVIEDIINKNVFSLIKFLNANTNVAEDKINLIPYNFGKTSNPYFLKYKEWNQIEDGFDRLPKLLRKYLINKNINVEHGKIYHLNYTSATNLIEYEYRKDIKLNATFYSSKHDYAIVAVPTPIVKYWKLPSFSKNLTDTLNVQDYTRACKVLLKFNKQFWDPKEFSGQLEPDSSTVTYNIIYPSHGNSTVVIASYVYIQRQDIQIGASIEEMEMIAIDEMRKIHGDIVLENYTQGNIERHCWQLDANALGGFPIYRTSDDKLKNLSAFKTMENNTVFVVDSTDQHAGWVGGAMNGAIRGVLQILIKDGHIDEARKIANDWNADFYHL